MKIFLDKNICNGDVDLFICPTPVEKATEIVPIEPTLTLEELLVNHLKKFPSITQSRKNGFQGPLPKGFKEWKVGKVHFITFLNFTDEIPENWTMTHLANFFPINMEGNNKL